MSSEQNLAQADKDKGRNPCLCSDSTVRVRNGTTQSKRNPEGQGTSTYRSTEREDGGGERKRGGSARGQLADKEWKGAVTKPWPGVSKSKGVEGPGRNEREFFPQLPLETAKSTQNGEKWKAVLTWQDGHATLGPSLPQPKRPHPLPLCC